MYPNEDSFSLLVCLGKSQAIFKGTVCLKINSEKSDLTVRRGKGEMFVLISVIISISALQNVGYSGIDINCENSLSCTFKITLS